MTSPRHPHAIIIGKNPNRVKVTFNGTVIADTSQALVLREGVSLLFIHPHGKT